MNPGLQTIDYAVIAAYLLGIAAIGLWMARRQKTTAEYFVADRRIPAWAVGFTLMATVISSVSFVAHPGAVFARDLWLLIPHLMVPVVLLFVVRYIVPLYRRVVRLSAYEYLE